MNMIIWKLASNSLATRANLVRRGVSISPLCTICDDVETRKHMLLGMGTLGHDLLYVGQQSVDEWLNMRVSTTGGGRADREKTWNLYMIICWQI